jgi:regulation of enolase protein 1 (concanavalin A-like superfamily)
VGLDLGNPNTANTLNYDWNNGSNATYGWSSGLTVPNQKWTFVALVISPSNATLYMQPLGGAMSSATNNVANVAQNFGNAATWFGMDTGAGRQLNGSMDDVRIYNVSLTAAQISAIANEAPTVAAAASANPNPVSGTTANLSVLGASDFGENYLTYTWSATSVPSGVTAPTFSANGTNAAKNTTVSLSGAGSYTFQATVSDVGGRTATSSVNVTVGGSLPGGWSGSDVGSVGVAGWSSSSGNTFTVNGAGGGIGGTSDAFQFSSQTLMGDGDIRAQVTSQTNTNANAMAGIMIRNDSTAGSVNALVALTPSYGFVFQTRGSAGGSTTQGGTAFSNAAPNNWVRLTKCGTLITAYVSANGTSWAQIGTATITMSSSVNVGLVVSSASSSTLGTATFSNVSVTPFPGPWQSLDLGTTGLQGSVEYFNGAYTVKGAGSVSGTSDSFRYVYQTLSGDGQLTARISNPQNTGTSALLGVMIRDQLTPGAMYACMGIDGTGAYKCQYRSATGGATSIVPAGSSGTAPNNWVQIVRSGNTLTGYLSADGVNWTQVTSQTITMGSEIYIGLVNASGSTTTLNSTVFDSLSVTP